MRALLAAAFIAAFFMAGCATGPRIIVTESPYYDGTGEPDTNNDACDSVEEVTAMVLSSNPGVKKARDLTGSDLQIFLIQILRQRAGHQALDMDRVIIFTGAKYNTAWVWAFKNGCAVGDEIMMLRVYRPVGTAI